jgi:hypothetical protein
MTGHVVKHDIALQKSAEGIVGSQVSEGLNNVENLIGVVHYG